jgi:hypothetical protein
MPVKLMLNIFVALRIQDNRLAGTYPWPSRIGEVCRIQKAGWNTALCGRGGGSASHSVLRGEVTFFY